MLDKKGFEQLLERENHRVGRKRYGVILPNIGLVVAGFHKRLPEGKYVIVFPRDKIEKYESMVDV